MVLNKDWDFLQNVEKHIKKAEQKIVNEEVGKIVYSLQRPFTEILQAVCEKQAKDVEELYKTLGWKS